MSLHNAPSDVATSVVLPHRAVASPHWVCTQAAVASPKLLWECLGRCKSSPMLTQWGDATARCDSATHRASVCPHPHSARWRAQRASSARVNMDWLRWSPLAAARFVRGSFVQLLELSCAVFCGMCRAQRAIESRSQRALHMINSNHLLYI